MSVRAIAWAYNQSPAPTDRCSSMAAKFVLVTLANHAGTDNRAWPTVDLLAVETELTDRAVRHALRSLVASGLITDTGDRRGRNRLVRVWQLNGESGSGLNPEPRSANPENPHHEPGTSAPRSKEEPSGNRKGTRAATRQKRETAPARDAVPPRLRRLVDRVAAGAEI